MARRYAPGKRLKERFRLERVLGTGGMATVWLGEDEELARPVAVKILSEALADKPDYAVRFGREARTAARVTHPNLVNVYDFDAEGERPFLVMEYVEGGTLAESVERGEFLDAEGVAREILDALRAIHEAGIVHRDVKPENVLVSGEGTMKLTDFGIAHPRDATRLTSTGEIIGTMRYVAPELGVGATPSPRSDLYSLGILLRECFPEGPGAVSALANRLAQADPERRPADAAAAFEGFGHEPSLATAVLQAAPAGPPETDEHTETLPREPLATAPAMEPAPIAVKRDFVHVHPVRLLAGIVAMTGALVGVAMLASDGANDGRPLIGPEARPGKRAEIRQAEEVAPRPRPVLPVRRSP